MKQTDRQAFTLIELSMALVIIGLLIGGVVVGRTMIEAAALRATASQYQRFDVAATTFKLKYNCLPGDCANVSSFGLDTDGSGDGLIDNSAEMVSFWRHLGATRLIEDSFPDFDVGAPNHMGGCDSSQRRCIPALKTPPAYNPGAYAYASGWMVVSLTKQAGVSDFTGEVGRHYFWISGAAGAGNDAAAVLTPEQAYGIDVKVDDGLPLSGKMIARSNDVYYDSGTDSGLGPTDAEMGGGGPNYDVCVANYIETCAPDPDDPDSQICNSTLLDDPQYNVINTSRHIDSLCSATLLGSF